MVKMVILESARSTNAARAGANTYNSKKMAEVVCKAAIAWEANKPLEVTDIKVLIAMSHASLVVFPCDAGNSTTACSPPIRVPPPSAGQSARQG
jgi:hypothetical protein